MKIIENIKRSILPKSQMQSGLFSVKYLSQSYTVLALLEFLAFFFGTRIDTLSVFALLNLCIQLLFVIISRSDKWDTIKYYILITWSMFNICFVSISIGFDSGYFLYFFAIPPVMIGIQYSQEHNDAITTPVRPFIYTVCCLLCVVGLYDLDRYHFLDTYYKVPVYFIHHTFRINVIITLFVLLYVMYSLKYKAFSFEDEREDVATIDMLTTLRNRSNLMRHLKAEHLKTYCACILDIDNFKRFNDTYGHDVGDLVLKELGVQIKEIETTHPDIYACRWGGEEFVILGTTTESYNVIEQELNILLQKRLKEPFIIEQNEYPITEKITFTAGLTYLHQKDTLDSLISRADNFLYIGKNKGRCCIVAIR